jgi:hypothetical protein
MNEQPTALEHQQNSANEALPSAKPTFGVPFTALNAKENALKAQTARKQRSFAYQQQLKEEHEAALLDATRYQRETLLCVREQLGRIYAMMKVEDEPQALDRLASAYAKLSEQERILDGRPLPGSHRPTKPKPTKADAGSYGPVE